VLKFIFQFDQWTEQNIVMLLCASADWLTNMLKHNYTATPENAETTCILQICRNNCVEVDLSVCIMLSMQNPMAGEECCYATLC
jgi:hypothetical protein